MSTKECNAAALRQILTSLFFSLALLTIVLEESNHLVSHRVVMSMETASFLGLQLPGRCAAQEAHPSMMAPPLLLLILLWSQPSTGSLCSQLLLAGALLDNNMLRISPTASNMTG